MSVIYCFLLLLTWAGATVKELRTTSKNCWSSADIVMVTGQKRERERK